MNDHHDAGWYRRRGQSRNRSHFLGVCSGQTVVRSDHGLLHISHCAQPIPTLLQITWINPNFSFLPVYAHVCTDFIFLFVTSAHFRWHTPQRWRPGDHVHQQASQVAALCNSPLDCACWVSTHFPQTLGASEEGPRAGMMLWGFNSPFIPINSCFNLRLGPISMGTWHSHCL